MGCCCSVNVYMRKCISKYDHDENDLVKVGEINGNQFSKYYFNNRIGKIYFKKNNHYYLQTVLEMDGFIIIPLMNENSEYVFFNCCDLIKDMKKKYHEELKNKIRNEVRLKFCKDELLLPN